MMRSSEKFPVPAHPLVMLSTDELYRLRLLWLDHSDPDTNGLLARINHELDKRED